MDNIFVYPWFRLDYLNGFIIGAVILFFLLAFIYSLKFMHGKTNLALYNFYLILTALVSIGALASNNLVILLACWGFLGILLYLLINMGYDNSDRAAKKALIIVGGSDALMVLGVAIMYCFSKSFQLDAIKLETNNGPALLAYACIAVACFAKAGAMPFHSWIPDCAKYAPIPVTAYLPASLDKLLGIYLLARASLDLFVINSAVNIFLVVIGTFSIIAAVMMALVQHNLKRLLGYHAVSQVGYMVLGIGTGNPVGIAAGLFHMLNNAVYKSCLFFTAGNVEYRAKTTELEKLGGLAKFMPVTYLCAVIASLSISGVPPFNGFVSKWMLYQGIIIALFNSQNKIIQLIYICAITAAMFGSVLTLASFMKLLHTVFLGQRIETLKNEGIREVSWKMWFPPLVLAVLCLVFGVFAFALPLKYFIFPAVSLAPSLPAGTLIGNWSPLLATLLILSGLTLGFLIFILMKRKFIFRPDTHFTGGEPDTLDEESMVSGVDFYNTVKELKPLRRIYGQADKGSFDIYERAKKVFSISKFLQFLHNGVLPTYLVWVLLGMVGLFLAVMRQ